MSEGLAFSAYSVDLSPGAAQISGDEIEVAMIHNLHNLIGWPSDTVLHEGKAVFAPPTPWTFFGWRDRLSDAWAVLTGKAVAVKWPKPGDFEEILHTRQIVPSNPRLKLVASR